MGTPPAPSPLRPRRPRLLQDASVTEAHLWPMTLGGHRLCQGAVGMTARPRPCSFPWSLPSPPRLGGPHCGPTSCSGSSAWATPLARPPDNPAPPSSQLGDSLPSQGQCPGQLWVRAPGSSFGSQVCCGGHEERLSRGAAVLTAYCGSEGQTVAGRPQQAGCAQGRGLGCNRPRLRPHPLEEQGASPG